MSLISLKAMPVPDVNYLMAKSHYRIRPLIFLNLTMGSCLKSLSIANPMGPLYHVLLYKEECRDLAGGSINT